MQNLKRYIESDGCVVFVSGNKFFRPKFKQCDTAYFNGGNYAIFNTVEQFKQSTEHAALVPVYCSATKKKGKSSIVTLASGLNTYEIKTWESAPDKWLKNETDLMACGFAYLVYLEKDSRAQNDFLIKTYMKIE